MKQETNDSESEEEILIFANFNDEKIGIPGPHVFKTIGIDTESPLIQLDNYIYKGNYQDCIGTNLFMEADQKPPDIDPIFGEQIEQPLKYVCKTRKNLNLEKIFIKPKCDTTSDTNSNEDTSTTISQQPQAASVQEAIDNFEHYITRLSSNRNNTSALESSNTDNEQIIDNKQTKRKSSFSDDYDST